MGSPVTPTVGQLLRTYRSRARLSQEQLGVRSGYSTDYISKLERGQRLPPFEALDRLMTVLDLDRPARDAVRSARSAAAAPAEAAEAADAASPGRGVTTLPVQVTSFVGRDDELSAITDLLDDPTVRLLTLTGPGGIGKTRLVVRLGELLADRFVDGLWFVPLATVTDPQHVEPAVASVLGVTERPGVTLTDAVIRLVGHGRGLLVLDNFEHVLAAAPFVGLLLERCPQLQVVVTSRAALSLAGEHRVEVPPLSAPATDLGGDVASIEAHAAVRLFVERARTVRPGFRLDATTAEDVGAICRALDGWPLAIELAAARLRLFPPQALRRRLSPRLALLSGGPVDRPQRHQTLRATIDWSYELLTPDEQLLFARLGVFAGGTLEAAEEVCDVAGDLDVVGLLTSLVDKSLARHGGEFEPRVWMLATIREYAVERLTAAGEDALLHDRHAAYYASLVTRIEPRLVGAQQDDALRQLDAEVDNVRAAMAWLVETGHVEDQLRMAVVFSWHQVARGSCTEAGQWLERGLDSGFAPPDAVRGRALLALGQVFIEQGHLDRAVGALEAAQSLCQAQGDRAGVGQALGRLGVIACRQGHYARAVALDEAALRLATEVGDRRERAYALVNLGTVATHLGEHATARERLSEAVELHRAIGDRDAMAHALINLGYDLTLQGHLAEATTVFEEVLATGRAFGFRRHVGYALENLGNIGVLQGDHSRAAARLREGLAVGRELSDQHLLLYLFSDLVKLHAARGRWEQAARLGGVVTGQRTRLGLSMAPAEDEGRAQALEVARASLGEHRYADAYAEGAATTLDEAVAGALTDP